MEGCCNDGLLLQVILHLLYPSLIKLLVMVMYYSQEYVAAGKYYLLFLVLTHINNLRITGIDCGDTAAQWLDGVLPENKMCRLIRQHPTASRTGMNLNQLPSTSASHFRSQPSVTLLCQPGTIPCRVGQQRGVIVSETES